MHISMVFGVVEFCFLACDRIYMKEQASIGSAEVKMKTPQGIVPADEKYVSAFLSTFSIYAEHGNYPANFSRSYGR